MTGFDPSRFLGDTSPRVAEDGGGWAAPEFEPKPAKTLDVWKDERGSVATAAAVAELTGDKPFAADLNRLFCEPGSARFVGKAWERLLLGIHAFADRHAAPALAAGWEPIELFGIKRGFLSEPLSLGHPAALRGMPLAAHGAAFVIGKREVLEVNDKFIRLVADRLGTEQRLFRDHHMSGRQSCALVWEVALF